MSRIFNQKNVWGAQGGLDAQRSDLWQIDFTQVVRGINDQIRNGPNSKTAVVETQIQPITSTVEPYYISSVSMPTLKVKAEEYRRDSRPYMMPGFDESLPEIKVVFILETPTQVARSKVYTFLDTWRAFVRAGRGALGNERTVTLNQYFKVGFKFPVSIILFRGNLNPVVNTIANMVTSEYYGTVDDLANDLASAKTQEEKNKRIQQILGNAGIFTPYNPIDNDLETCGLFQIEGMWLSGFKVTDLDYSKGNEITRIEASFFADNIRDLNQQ